MKKLDYYVDMKKKTERKFLIVIILAILCLSACGRENEEEMTIEKYCMQFVSEYEVLQEKEEGTIEISVTAPDFERVVKTALLEDEDMEMTSEALKKAVERYPDYKKEYRFYSNSVEIEDVETAFLEKVSYDLAIGAITTVEYEEEWGKER